MNLDLSQPYCIISKHSGKALDIDGAKHEDGVRLQQWTLYGGANQQWRLLPSDDGFHEIVALHSGKCMDDGYLGTLGGRVHQWSRHKGENQKWKFIAAEDGAFEIASKMGDLRLDVEGFSSDNGGTIHLWSRSGNVNQKWMVVSSNDIVTPDVFRGRLLGMIDAKCAELMAAKPHDGKFLNYTDAAALTASVRNVFRNKVGRVPNQIEVALVLSEAVLAPSTLEKIDLLKKALGLAGGLAGLGMIIAGIGTALGWGAGVIALIKMWLLGAPFWGPLGWITGGAAVAAIAAYFALTNDAAKDSERFLNALKNGVGGAILPVWAECGDRLWQK